MRFLVVPSLLAAVIVIAACSGDDDGTATTTVRETVTETGTATGTVPDEAPRILAVYFLRDGKVAPILRGVVTGPAVARAALNALLEGGAEEGLQTAIPPGTRLRDIAIASGVAQVDLSRPIPPPARAQIVYTLTQFPTVERVLFLAEGRPTVPPTTRADQERFTPAILVERPTPGETVEPGFEATGTANTFEATFNYELKNASGRVLSRNFVTATSGSGTRGTFRFTVPYEVDRAQEGSLTVFEISAANGSRTNEVTIPLRLE